MHIYTQTHTYILFAISNLIMNLILDVEKSKYTLFGNLGCKIERD